MGLIVRSTSDADLSKQRQLLQRFLDICKHALPDYSFRMSKHRQDPKVWVKNEKRREIAIVSSSKKGSVLFVNNQKMGEECLTLFKEVLAASKNGGSILIE